MSSRAKNIEEDAGDGYFASVSDLMVGILFIFLLMLTVFALNFHDAADEQQVARKQYEEALQREQIALESAQIATAKAVAEKAKADEQIKVNQQLQALLTKAVAQLERDMEERQLARNRLLTSLEQSLHDRNIRVTIDPTSGILRLSGDLLFETGQSVLKPDARQTVSVLADVLVNVLGCYAEGGKREGCDADSKSILESMLVEGHTDRQPYRYVPIDQSLERNDRLSTDRALEVFKELRQFQPGLDAFQNGDRQPLMAFSGYGQRRPLPNSLGTSEADYQRNRRIDLRFVLTARTSDELNRLREQIKQMLDHS